MIKEDSDNYLSHEKQKAEDDTENLLTRMRNSAQIISHNKDKAVHHDYAQMAGTLTEYCYMRAHRDNLRTITPEKK